MQDTDSSGSIRFYFSFRSPYAWLAAERLEDELADLGVPIERIPIYPTPEIFPNDPAAMPAKVAYLVQDVRRLTRERGLALRFPTSSEADWALPHAASLAADRLGAGHAFMLALFRKRWMEGLDVGDEGVVGDAAEAAGLDAGDVLAAARSDELRTRATEAWSRAAARDGIFGVPSFVYAGKLYWGQDRMHFLRDAVIRKSAAFSSAE